MSEISCEICGTTTDSGYCDRCIAEFGAEEYGTYLSLVLDFQISQELKKLHGEYMGPETAPCEECGRWTSEVACPECARLPCKGCGCRNCMC